MQPRQAAKKLTHATAYTGARPNLLGTDRQQVGFTASLRLRALLAGPTMPLWGLSRHLLPPP